MSNTYIIAEAGVNHNGEEDLAFALIKAAKEVGADAVKFQLFSADALTTQTAPQAAYQKREFGQESQYQMLKKLELSHASFQRMQKYAIEIGIEFLTTPFDSISLDFLVDVLNLPILKIGSGDLTNGPFLLQAARTLRPIILSTGMSSLPEIEAALKILAYGLSLNKEVPTLKSLEDNFKQAEIQAKLKKTVSLLHCVSEYPAPAHEMNLRAMDTLRNAFELKVGLSDHTSGIQIALAAVAREAQIIEKHFTLDNNLLGPDHKASLDPIAFKAMIEGIRMIESALGNGQKIPTLSELKNQSIVRRSIVANDKIHAGDLFTTDNLTFKRPSGGLSPMDFWDLLGKKATKSYAKDEFIS